ncbi:tetratricopeptide repeat protein [Ornithinimicrobium sufpigmenti]|uniref:tetratricopeptide repeat protein n=1 Tax=Ornithinimicrobium sufpigmenti TaxID=2508882 RepID=UPI001EE14F0E|nr:MULTISPECIES: tetratricopeptide repeat protein [unclassified Ornithinimicrobium]
MNDKRDRPDGDREGRDERRGGPRHGGGSRQGGGPRQGGSQRRPERREERRRDDRGRAGGPSRSDRDDRGRSGYQGRPERDDRERRPPRPKDPELPEDAHAGVLDRTLRAELRTLSKENAEGVGGHLVMVGRFLDAEDFDQALAHAEAASRRAGRVPVVREALGLVHYRRGEWAKALTEFRTARRMSGTHHLLPLMADCERGLGRPERALELAVTREARTLGAAEQVELAIVVAGARGDLGQHAAAVLELKDLATRGTGREPWAARVRYAYAAALEAVGRPDEAALWFQRAADVDETGETDAAEVIGLEDEPLVLDLVGDDDEHDGEENAEGDQGGQGAPGGKPTGRDDAQ